ncbi:9083_t:CDS:2, partial [Dentiscutata heterogama]
MAEDYKQLYETRENYDVIIYTGEEPNSEEIHAHSLVLRTRSTYFRGALASDWAIKDKDNGCFSFKKPNISSSIFELILKFLYCGEVDIQDQEGETILDLLISSDELGLTSLIDHVQQYFIANQKSFLQQNPVGMLHMAARHETFNEIGKFALETICASPDILFDSNNKFHEISMPDFYHKVFPYMSILPHHLYDDILRCYMVPNAVPLYNEFPPRNRRISSHSYAIYCHSGHGPNFGSGDLHLNGNYVYANGNGYYPSIGTPNGSQIEDYEVFQ